MQSAVTHGLGIADVIGDKRDDILRIATERGAFNVRIFGSVARNQARADSDIDFLVEFVPGYRLLDLAGLLNDLETLLNRRVEIAIEKNLRPEFRDAFCKTQFRCKT